MIVLNTGVDHCSYPSKAKKSTSPSEERSDGKGSQDKWYMLAYVIEQISLLHYANFPGTFVIGLKGPVGWQGNMNASLETLYLIMWKTSSATSSRQGIKISSMMP
jgi:hypothetical protein